MPKEKQTKLYRLVANNEIKRAEETGFIAKSSEIYPNVYRPKFMVKKIRDIL